MPILTEADIQMEIDQILGEKGLKFDRKKNVFTEVSYPGGRLDYLLKIRGKNFLKNIWKK